MPMFYGCCEHKTLGTECCKHGMGHPFEADGELMIQMDPPTPQRRKASIYLIGSLRNPRVPVIARRLRSLNFDVFDDWFAAGPEADDYWQKYEQARKHKFTRALRGHAARHVYEYDKFHLDRCDAAVLVLPAGKSGHLEFGYMVGQGKPGYILLDGEPKRFDVMYNFATKVFTNLGALCRTLIS